MSLWQGKRQEARGKSEEGLGDFTFLYTVWFYCVHLLNPERYLFITVNPELGEAGFRPHLPLRLTYQKRSIQTSALLDTGAMVNVLPYHYLNSQ